jgi:tungstate transport system ATP-binding protein
LSESALYRLENVTKRYGERTVLRIDRLEIGASELVCLLGPTGAGKSTLLRLLGGLEPPSAGQLWFRDCALNGRLPTEIQRCFTLVFQKPLLLNESVTANIEYGLRLQGIRDRHMKVEALLERLNLRGLAGQPAQRLSGGETQLVALARGLVLETGVLLLDEPTAHLDPARVALVEEVVREAHQQRGTTIVWATHNIFQARRLAQRVALLLNGELVEIAPVHEFFESPRDPRSGAFVRGEMIY